MKNANGAETRDMVVVQKQEAWLLTDNDTLQCRRVLDEDQHVYELVQVDDYTSVDQGYRISQATISLEEYSPEEILKYLKQYGYEDLEEFKGMHSGEIPWGIIAEMVFETSCVHCEGERFETFSAAGKNLEQITGLKLSEYYNEENDEK